MKGSGISNSHPLKKEKDKTDGKGYPDMYPFDFFFLHSLCPQKGKGKEYHTKQLGEQAVIEQPRSMLEVEQDLGDYSDVDAPFFDGGVTEPIDIDNNKEDA